MKPFKKRDLYRELSIQVSLLVDTSIVALRYKSRLLMIQVSLPLDTSHVISRVGYTLKVSDGLF